jgi:septal ring factor EnvC (AmiA/AmiB activator)
VRRAVRAAFIATLIFARLAGALEREAPAEQLRQLDDQKRRAESVLREIEGKRGAVLEVLDRIEHDRRTAEEQARSAESKEAATTAELNRARQQQESIHARRVALAHDLGPRLLLRYRLRGASYLQMILSAPSIGDLLWRRRMVDRVLASDFSLVRRWSETQREEDEAVAVVDRQRADLVTAASAARAQEADAATRRTVQEEVLHGLVRKRSTWDRILGDVERSRSSIIQVISTLPPTPPGLGGFGHARGQLPTPVDGPVEVRFGRQVDPKFRTVLQQKGFDFRAPEGSPVRAPYPAMVGYAGWFSGFGNLVILDHGEGYYTLYAHLKEAKVAKGQRVDAGDTLGEVGDTGSLKGPYLYFEIRSGSKALDPAQWLKRR